MTDELIAAMHDVQLRLKLLSLFSAYEKCAPHTAERRAARTELIACIVGDDE